MYEKFYQLFFEIKLAEEYYLLYVQRSKFWERTINIVACAGSTFGILSFVNDWLPPFVSSLIVLFAQIASVIQPFYPFGDRVYAGHCIYYDLSELTLECEQIINQHIHVGFRNNTLLMIYGCVQDTFLSIEKKYATSDLFPRKDAIHKKAENNAKTYVDVHFSEGG